MTNYDSENKNITPEEFKQMNSEEKIMRMTQRMVPPPGMSQAEALNAVLNKTEKITPTKTFRIGRIMKAAAAVIIILIGIKLAPSIFSHERQLKANYAELSEVTLPDGSDVVLNADSKLIWNNKKFKQKRELTLTGEAYFDVEKGKQFIIKTKNGTVEILGTQLNVFSRENRFWVSCIEGKVRVMANGQQQIITPGEFVKLHGTDLEKSNSESIENTISWRTGIFHFEETPLVAIFAELERQFDVAIKFEGNKKRMATVDFSNKNLKETLDIVCIPMELDYEIKNNNKVLIFEKK